MGEHGRFARHAQLLVAEEGVWLDLAARAAGLKNHSRLRALLLGFKHKNGGNPI